MFGLSNQQLCYLYALTTNILWAAPFVFTRIALQSYSVTSLSALRYLFAALFSLALGFIMKIGFPRWKDVPKFFLAGGLGFGLYIIIFNTALKTINSATGSVIIAIAPILAALIALFLFREKIPFRGWIAIALEFIGIVILALWDGIFSVDVGILWMLLAAVINGSYAISQRILTKEYTSFQSATYCTISAGVFLSVFLPGSLPELAAAPVSHTLILVFLGIFPASLAALCWSKAISLARKTSDATNFMFVNPLFSALLAFLVAGETLTLATVFGGIIIIGGLILFGTAQSPETREAAGTVPVEPEKPNT